MQRTLLILSTAAAILWLPLRELPARAAIVMGTYEIELFAGYYNPNPVVLDKNVSVGLRFGYNVTENLNIRGEMTYFDTGGNFATYHGEFGDITGTVDYSALTFEFPLSIYPYPNSKWITNFFLGPGFSFVSSEVKVSDERFPFESGDLEKSGFTILAGIGVRREFGKRFFANLVGRSRWHAARDQDRLDWEATLGLGITFGH